MATPNAWAGKLVVHCDVDSFYCQVERLDDPALMGVPLAVRQFNAGGFVAVSYEVLLACHRASGPYTSSTVHAPCKLQMAYALLSHWILLLCDIGCKITTSDSWSYASGPPAGLLMPRLTSRLSMPCIQALTLSG